MSRQRFREIGFSNQSKILLKQIIDILNDYSAQGYQLSLRQLYYQLVSKNIVPNSERSYNNIGNLVSKGRNAGVIDWDMIVDRGRETIIPQHWNSPAEILEIASRSYHIDKWQVRALRRVSAYFSAALL